MIEALKKTILAGVGAAVVTQEKIEAALEDMVAQGKISAEEARKAASRIAADGRREFKQASRQLGGVLKDAMGRADSKAAARIAALEARLAALERKAAARRRTRKP